MAEQRIPGRNGTATIISDSYGTTIFSGPPEPIEQPRAEDKKLDGRQVQKKFKWTAEQFDAAVARPTFPRSGKRSSAGSWTLVPIWNESALDRWATEERALAAAITALLGR